MERRPRTVREVTQIQHFIQAGERRLEEHGKENGIEMPVLRCGTDAGEEPQRGGADLP